MSILKLENGQILSHLSDIQRELATLNIQIEHQDLGKSLRSPELLAQDILSQQEKQRILHLYENDFEVLKQKVDYHFYDLLVLHPGSPNLYTLAAAYSRYHTHKDAEALYILAGEAMFGFVQPEGNQVQLLVQAHDYIYIPAEVEHWFSPAASLHVKALRYFTSADGWIPEYTGTRFQDFLRNEC
ncbi:cupin domain-containing protein [Chlorogloeopsis sp. ULAP01]|uniref:cupin domain-containing protein n=1 Tax=Chlorogloeopsis sp. ULAP01 TaxID=3056483 RepID=UPI0025AAF999|nr:cupin domain-containing protein [Chlorogloeopsis sp. ULAP01]MDM9384050.1 cupin domain-containing protein [Chlorogloeopsis sp. ULAP01]